MSVNVKSTYLIIILSFLFSCKKDSNNSADDCFKNYVTIREINNKTASVKKVSDTDFFLVETGSIDEQLEPCNLPDDFKVDGLIVTISGHVKNIEARICCTNGIVLTSITH